MMVDLGAGATGFLKYKTPPTERAFLVQVKTHVGEGKAAPVRESPLLKGRYVILVLGESGAVNVSKAIDPDRRDASESGGCGRGGRGFGNPTHCLSRRSIGGYYRRSMRYGYMLAADIRARCSGGGSGGGIAVGLVHAAPSARALALRDWGDVPIIDEAGCFERLGVADQIESLDSPIAGFAERGAYGDRINLGSGRRGCGYRRGFRRGRGGAGRILPALGICPASCDCAGWAGRL